MFLLAVVLETSDHAKPGAVVAMSAVIARGITMAPHDMIDDGAWVVGVKLLIAFRTENKLICCC